jgi:serine/threonine-protein kinase RsbW
MAEARNLEVKLDSTLDSVDVAEEMVRKFASEEGFSEDDVHQIGMAVRESVINAVVHGNCYNVQKKVLVAVEAAGNRLTIRVQDQGAGFDPDNVPDPLAEENLMSKSGRGLFLMRAFMDDLRMNRLRPEGMEVVLVKRSSPNTSQEEEAK